jgi:hypothetical protein
MPLDRNNKYSAPEGLSRTISCPSSISYSRAQGSTHFGPHPYPSICDIASRVDANDACDSWYNHAGNDLYFCDFGFQARLQVARRLTQCVDCGVG